MELVGKEILDAFKQKHSDARSHIDAWEAEVKEHTWSGPHDLKAHFPKASLVGNKQVVFNIYGNNYRLWVKVAYNSGVVFVKNVGTHKEYEKWEIK
jgi:mRNA interferase HigB